MLLTVLPVVKNWRRWSSKFFANFVHGPNLADPLQVDTTVQSNASTALYTTFAFFGFIAGTILNIGSLDSFYWRAWWRFTDSAHSRCETNLGVWWVWLCHVYRVVPVL